MFCNFCGQTASYIRNRISKLSRNFRARSSVLRALGKGSLTCRWNLRLFLNVRIIRTTNVLSKMSHSRLEYFSIHRDIVYSSGTYPLHGSALQAGLRVLTFQVPVEMFSLPRTFFTFVTPVTYYSPTPQCPAVCAVFVIQAATDPVLRFHWVCYP